MDYTQDSRVVMTLDAGGTNFVFSAMRANKQIVEPIRKPSNGHQLDLSLKTIIEGFRKVQQTVPEKPVAISFAFPGPADYPNGIIEKLINLPAYTGGVALSKLLNDIFDLPVYINNDGNLFGLGEALAGFLPQVNRDLAQAKSPKRFRNLIGVTFGTGFGGSVIIDQQMLVGDNSAAGEIWSLRNRLSPEHCAEEGVSIRGVRNFYARLTGTDFRSAPSPIDIFKIAEGRLAGDRNAAQKSFAQMGRVAGDALAHAVALIDGLVVIGGGLAGAGKWFLPALVEEMNAPYINLRGEKIDRLELLCYNYEDDQQRNEFLKGRVQTITVPMSHRTITYDNFARTAVGISRLGTSQAIAVGAYCYALTQLDTWS
ncbi:ROK family protein [candidate division KSB1 bacterium]|nr:ROK family protein [candidate division KSB1 bacterium]